MPDILRTYGEKIRQAYNDEQYAVLVESSKHSHDGYKQILLEQTQKGNETINDINKDIGRMTVIVKDNNDDSFRKAQKNELPTADSLAGKMDFAYYQGQLYGEIYHLYAIQSAAITCEETSYAYYNDHSISITPITADNRDALTNAQWDIQNPEFKIKKQLKVGDLFITKIKNPHLHITNPDRETTFFTINPADAQIEAARIEELFELLIIDLKRTMGQKLSNKESGMLKDLRTKKDEIKKELVIKSAGVIFSDNPPTPIAVINPNWIFKLPLLKDWHNRMITKADLRISQRGAALYADAFAKTTKTHKKSAYFIAIIFFLLLDIIMLLISPVTDIYHTIYKGNRASTAEIFATPNKGMLADKTLKIVLAIAAISATFIPGIPNSIYYVCLTFSLLACISVLFKKNTGESERNLSTRAYKMLALVPMLLGIAAIVIFSFALLHNLFSIGITLAILAITCIVISSYMLLAGASDDELALQNFKRKIRRVINFDNKGYRDALSHDAAYKRQPLGNEDENQLETDLMRQFSAINFPANNYEDTLEIIHNMCDQKGIDLKYYAQGQFWRLYQRKLLLGQGPMLALIKDITHAQEIKNLLENTTQELAAGGNWTQTTTYDKNPYFVEYITAINPDLAPYKKTLLKGDKIKITGNMATKAFSTDANIEYTILGKDDKVLTKVKYNANKKSTFEFEVNKRKPLNIIKKKAPCLLINFIAAIATVLGITIPQIGISLLITTSLIFTAAFIAEKRSKKSLLMIILPALVIPAAIYAPLPLMIFDLNLKALIIITSILMFGITTFNLYKTYNKNNEHYKEHYESKLNSHYEYLLTSANKYDSLTPALKSHLLKNPSIWNHIMKHSPEEVRNNFIEGVANDTSTITAVTLDAISLSNRS